MDLSMDHRACGQGPPMTCDPIPNPPPPSLMPLPTGQHCAQERPYTTVPVMSGGALGVLSACRPVSSVPGPVPPLLWPWVTLRSGPG